MRKLFARRPAGDTLIEVIFAFAILGTIIGFAYTGVIQARKNAVAAQMRTQGQLLVQYQTEALKAYRASLPWDNNEGCPSFLNGGASGVFICGSSSLPNLVSAGSNNYCLFAQNNNWVLALFSNSSVSAECFNAERQPNGNYKPAEPSVTITFTSVGRLGSDPISGGAITSASNTVQANISAEWTDPFGQKQTVKSIVIMSKQR